MPSTSPYRLVVPGNPLPKSRARTFYDRRVRKMVTKTPKRTAEWEEKVRAHCEAQMLRDRQEMFTGPVAVTLRFHRKDFRRVDLDNLQKAVLDGLNGVAWSDDSQIREVRARIMFGAVEPRVEIAIEETMRED